jgi:hypothetical protein
MGRFARLVTGALLAAALTGCVERRFIIESNPPGAVVYQNGQYAGITPVEVPFVYYGKYQFELVKDGYETRTYEVRARAPWYEWPGLDFLSENVYPGHIQDNRREMLTMEPLGQQKTENLMNKANELRQRGAAIPTPTRSEN